MSTNYMPSGDAEFLTWSENFKAYFAAHAISMGFTAGDATNITAVVDGYDDSLGQHVTKQDAAHAARQQKDADKSSAEDDIRALVRRIQASPQVTDEDRQALGITVRDPMHTLGATVALNAPVASVDTAKRLMHTIRYWDSQGEGKARPEGAIAAEIWSKVTAPGEAAPDNPSQFTFLAMNSASPLVNQLGDSDGGKTAHYLIRWVARDGSKGPWSEIISATIAGF